MAETNSRETEAKLKLMLPPASQTDTSIALVWEKPDAAQGVEAYRVYLDGKLLGQCACTDYTATGLSDACEYAVSVQAVCQNGETLQSDTLTVKTKPAAQVFDVTAFGAVGDGRTLNTKAVQSAIDACVPGGKVYIPRGVFLTGAVFLKGDLTLYIAEGGVLLGSDRLADYPLMQYRFEGLETTCYASLINTVEAGQARLKNITIDGPGKIDANGTGLRQKELAEKKGKPGRALCLRSVDHVYLHDITVKQSPAWCVHLIYCSHISLNQVKIYTKYDEDGTPYPNIINGDGFDPDSCSDLFVFHSLIASEDDCIAIKSGRDAEGRRVGIPSENIRITNCTFQSGFGVAVGSEMSGGVRNVLVQDCVFENVYSVASLKAPRGRGGVIENIRYEDLTQKNHSLENTDCEWFRGAIYIDQFYSHITFDADEAEEAGAGTAVIRNVVLKNIRVDTLAGNAVYLTGLPESPLQNIRLSHVRAIGKYGLKANNIQGLELDDVSVESREDKDYVFHHVEGLKVLPSPSGGQ